MEKTREEQSMVEVMTSIVNTYLDENGTYFEARQIGNTVLLIAIGPSQTMMPIMQDLHARHGALLQ